MTITDEQDERLTLILAGLKSELDALYPSAKSFVSDQIRRHEQYGSEIRVSPRQWQWLEDLYRQFVGEDEQRTPREEQAVDERMEEKSLRDDMDDEVPF